MLITSDCHRQVNSIIVRKKHNEQLGKPIEQDERDENLYVSNNPKSCYYSKEINKLHNLRAKRSRRSGQVTYC